MDVTARSVLELFVDRQGRGLVTGEINTDNLIGFTPSCNMTLAVTRSACRRS